MLIHLDFIVTKIDFCWKGEQVITFILKGAVEDEWPSVNSLSGCAWRHISLLKQVKISDHVFYPLDQGLLHPLAQETIFHHPCIDKFSGL